jgi:ribosomal protein S18 acetylase RimI-like enzyme
MSIQIIEIGPDRLNEYDKIPSQFKVRALLQPELVNDGIGGILLHERVVEEPYNKDYDAAGELPSDVRKMFDVTKWGFFLVIDPADKVVGGATVAFDTTRVFMLENRHDLSVLWDIRVSLKARGAGIPLFRAAAQWSRKRGCKQMKIETQNVNIPARRFYQRMGCRLGEIRRFGYAAIPQVANEVMLCWYLDL